MQPDDRQSSFRRVENVAVARITTPGLPWFGTGGQDALNGMGAGSPSGGHKADLGNLTQPKGWMLGLQIDDQLAQGREKKTPIFRTLWRAIDEETGQPLLVEALGLAMDSSGSCTCLLGALAS